VLTPFLVSPSLRQFLLASNFLPHLYCYLRNPVLVWTHVVADTLIAASYLAISVTLCYVVSKAWRDLPFHWILLAFGLFIIACGGTHFMEVLTIWIPVYVLSAAVKIFTALASLTTAVVLPFVAPRVFTLVEQAKTSELATVELRASQERKEALLREVHHRVKNNLAVICSLFYLQSTHTKDQGTVQIFMTWKIGFIRWLWCTRACTAPRILRASTSPSMPRPSPPTYSLPMAVRMFPSV
ncbi:MAG: histidine kinase dimerization/phosphoacceptor domain -containing protein, partial [Terriglobales bacterium]